MSTGRNDAAWCDGRIRKLLGYIDGSLALTTGSYRKAVATCSQQNYEVFQQDALIILLTILTLTSVFLSLHNLSSSFVKDTLTCSVEHTPAADLLKLLHPHRRRDEGDASSTATAGFCRHGSAT